MEYEESSMRLFYSTYEAARILGVSLPTVVNWIKARRISAHRTPGGHRRIAREDLAAFMLRQGMPLPDELADAAPGRLKVLVVDEPGPVREGLAQELSAAGYAVEQAAPGFAAGVAAARAEPDVLVLQAPAPDGGEVLRGFRADRELTGAPVVVLAPQAWRAQLLDAGCAEVLEQAPAAGLLDAAVRRALTAIEDSRPPPPSALSTPVPDRAGEEAGD
jgi:excisionase family DNA binding protein